MDLVRTLKTWRLPADHPLFLLVDEPRRLGTTVGDGLWLRSPLVGEQSSFSLYGIGVGSRLTMFDDINAAVDLAIPLTKGAVTKAGDMRVHFRVSSGF